MWSQAQRHEGETYGPFTVEAGYGSALWSDPATASGNTDAPGMVSYPDFDPPDADSTWDSPNGSFVTSSAGGTGISVWVDPPVYRYMEDPAKSETLGRDSCGEPVAQSGGGWLRTCKTYWTEALEIELSREDFNEVFGHNEGIIHGTADHEQHLHILDGSARLDAHRHCATHDVNGDGDTDDDEDNDGTCPGPDDPDDPDLAWHPSLPAPGDPWWQTALESLAVTEGTGAGATGAAKLIPKLANYAGPVGGFVGALAGVGYAFWTRDGDHYHLTITGRTGCLDNENIDGWTVQETSFEKSETEGAYTTKTITAISYCEQE